MQLDSSQPGSQANAYTPQRRGYRAERPDSLTLHEGGGEWSRPGGLHFEHEIAAGVTRREEQDAHRAALLPELQPSADTHDLRLVHGQPHAAPAQLLEGRGGRSGGRARHQNQRLGWQVSPRIGGVPPRVVAAFPVD